MNALRVLSMCACLAAAVGCDISYEVLTYENDDGGASVSPPSQCDCGEQEICVSGRCLVLPEYNLLATGDRHTCRIDQGQLWCWGDNTSDQLGLALDEGDVVTRPQRVGTRADWRSVAAGSRHTCALRQGVLRCWGDDSEGQLGESNARSREQSRVPWGDFAQIKCGGDNCCALRSGGRLYCWGSNRDGRLGIGSDDDAPVAMPTQISVDQTFLRAFSVGASHSCAVASDRTLWCWGSNAEHKLGLEEEDGPVRAPRQIGEDKDWLWVAAGGTQTCGIRKGNELYCWGDNSDGQVGIARIGPDGELVVSEKPVIVNASTDWVRVQAGDRHTCAIKRSQPLFCWGRGDKGQLGLVAAETVETPTAVQGVLSPVRFQEIALGAAYSCGVDVSSPQPATYCWGENDRGQLGNGSTEATLVPARVMF
jgi:alpha-tubulin suppressor-like RCC1 family protein